MGNRRENNAKIFQDTERQCRENSVLKKAIALSNEAQYIVYETDGIATREEHRYTEPAKIIVSKKRSFEAASAYKGMKICVHNFASATNPGGGVTRGSSAQEEALCRCSTLYFNISENVIRNNFHEKHRQMLRVGEMDATYNADCIYTPGVIVFKTDTASPETMPEDEWYSVDIITCAAPNLRKQPSNAMNPGSGRQAVCVTEEELLELHKKRIRRIFAIAKKEKEEVIILGAFGCGAFCNPPQIVAEAMAQVMKDYQYDFKVIEFAVYCTEWETENYDEFHKRCRL